MPRTVAWIKIGATLLAVILLVRFVGAAELARSLGAADPAWLVAMYATSLVSFSLTALSLRLLLVKAGLSVGFGRVALVNAIATLHGLVLPGDLIAGVSKWAMLASATGNRATVLSAIVFNKAALAIPLLVIGTVAFTVHDPFPGIPAAAVAATLGAVAAGGAVLALHPTTGTALARRALRATRKLPARVRRPVESLAGSLEVFRGFRPRDHAEVLAVTSSAVCVGFAGFACATRALDLAVPVTALPWIAMVLFLGKILPITVSSLGVREGILVVLLGRFGVSAAEATAVGLLLFSNSVLLAAAGAAGQLALPLGPPR